LLAVVVVHSLASALLELGFERVIKPPQPWAQGEADATTTTTTISISISITIFVVALNLKIPPSS